MTLFASPLWTEGMLMLPHHMQQLERHWAARLEGRVSGLRAGGWGLRSLVLDASLLPLGKVGIVSCEAILPDGSVVSVPNDGDGPLVCDVPPAPGDRLIKLALPLGGLGQPMTEEAGAAPGRARFRLVERQLRDVTAPDRTEERVALAAPTLRLIVAGTEPEDELACLPVALVRREDAADPVTVSAEFLPPAIDLRATPRYAQLMREVEGLLRTRGDALATRVDPARGNAELAGMLDFAMLQTVNRAQPIFAALGQGRGVHPETAYLELLRLAGELAIFGEATRRPPALPAYDHADPTPCFAATIGVIRKALSTLTEQAAISLPLNQHQYGLWLSPISDRSLLADATFVLIVSASRHPEEIRTGFPGLVKLGPAEGIRELISLQVPGIPLQPMPVAPRELPYRSNAVYFALDRSSNLWRRLAESVAIAFHVGGDFPDLRLEFWAIRPRA